jgi:hypothetical protein
MTYHPAWNHYGAVGEVTEGDSALIERRETRADAELDLLRERLVIEKAQVKATERAAFFEGLQTLVIVAIPIAVFFGFDRWFKSERKKQARRAPEVIDV